MTSSAIYGMRTIKTLVTELQTNDLVYVGGGMYRKVLHVLDHSQDPDQVVVVFQINGSRNHVSVSRTALYSRVI
jgi:preprotein translocase subunit YajC